MSEAPNPIEEAMGIDPEEIEKLEKEVGGELEGDAPERPEPKATPSDDAKAVADLNKRAEAAESGETNLEDRAEAAESAEPAESAEDAPPELDPDEYERRGKAEMGLTRRVAELARKNRELQQRMQAGAQVPPQQNVAPPQPDVPRGTPEGPVGQIPVQLDGPNAFVPRDEIERVAYEAYQRASQPTPQARAAAQYQHARNTFVTQDPTQMAERELAVREMEQGWQAFQMIMEAENAGNPAQVQSLDDLYHFIDERGIRDKLAAHAPRVAPLVNDYVDLLIQPLSAFKLQQMTSKLGAAENGATPRESAPLTLGQKPRSIATKGSGDLAPVEASRSRLDELMSKAEDPLAMSEEEMAEFEELVNKFG